MVTTRVSRGDRKKRSARTTLISSRLDAPFASPDHHPDWPCRVRGRLPAADYGTTTQAGKFQATEGAPLPKPEPALFGGDQISAANPAQDSKGGRAIGFSLHDQGSKLFADYTSKHVGEFFAIVLDGTVVSAPSINGAITGGSGIIETGTIGGFSTAEVNRV